ncbi:MAG: class I SAM-dependent methyltransferase [Saprospiraceae bacterium]|nr:class I SAM-dependent methyltransferase [Saprospiraceae bacterium]
MTLELLVYKIKSWAAYYWRATTKFNIQSPFFTEFVREVMDNEKEYYIFDKIEHIRKTLLQDSTKVPKIDFGAGSQKQHTRDTLQIKDIAGSSLSTKKQCRMLFNLMVWKKPKNVIELGTSLGISTAYLAAANKKVKMTGFEGNPYVADIAKNVLEKAGLGHVNIITGAFKETLPEYLKSSNRVDIAFIDGHHEEFATLAYFEMILPYLSDDAVIIFDDIYWSQGMENAWKKICLHLSVAASFDIFDLGIVFIKPGLAKENINYIPYYLKPWKTGLFGK